MLLKQETVRHGDKVWTVRTTNLYIPATHHAETKLDDLRYAATIATELDASGTPVQGSIHGVALWGSLETHENFVRQLTETGEIAESPW